MKKMIIMGVLLLCTLFAQAQVGGITISNGTSKNQAFRGVFLRKSLLPDVLLAVKEGTVWLSEKPGGEESGYYGIQTNNGIFYNGKKEKIKTNQMTDVGDGWFFYDFGKDLYILRFGLTTKLENIRLLPSEQAKAMPSAVGNASNTSTTEELVAENNNVSPKEDDIPIPPFTKLEPQCPTPENDGWTLVKTEENVNDTVINKNGRLHISKESGATIYWYTKEIDDEDKTCWVKKSKNGDFKSSLVSDMRETIDGGVVRLVKGNLFQLVFPNGWIKQNKLPRRDKRGLIYWNETSSDEDILYTEANGDYTGTKQITLKNSSDYWLQYDYMAIAKGFLIGDRLYYEDPEKGVFIPYMQKFNGKFFYASPRDTIIDVQSSTDSLVIRFKNGDRYKKVYGDGGGVVIDLHRSNGYFRKRKNEDFAILNLDDGAKITCWQLQTDNPYVGADSYRFVDFRRSEHDKQCLLFMDETPDVWGWITKPNGSEYIVQFSRLYKKSEEQLEREKEEAEEAKKRESYIKKYGFYPGDYKSIKDVLKPGRPIAAIKEYYALCSLIRDDGASQQYRVTYNWTSTTTYNAYVTVRNGKIVSVRFP